MKDRIAQVTGFCVVVERKNNRLVAAQLADEAVALTCLPNGHCAFVALDSSKTAPHTHL